MAHNLEIGEGGQVAFALRGEPAWHGLASRVFSEDESVSTSDMLDSAYLSGWNVRLEDLSVPDGYRSVDDRYMVVRTNPFDMGTDILSVVGKRYRTYQNEDLFAFGDNILDGGGKWESAGSIKDGKQVFGSLAIPHSFTLDPEGASDEVRSYLLVTTSHDGSSAIQALVTPVRVVCQNTLNMALKGCAQSYKVRHTETASGRVEEARRALNISFTYMDKFEEMAQELYAQSITDAQFDKLVATIYPEPTIDDPKLTHTRYTDKVDTIKSLYRNSPTNATITGTKWGAFNALTEYIDYYRVGRKGTDNSGILASASGFDPLINSKKNDILQLVKSL